MNNSSGLSNDLNASIVENMVSQFYNSYIPSDVLLNIFFRLPIKAVMRCKCVCRDWYSIISEPKFSDDYKINSSLTPALIPPRPGVGTSYETLQLLIEISENGDYIRTPIMPRIPDFEKENEWLFNINTCNGLLCFCFKRSEPWTEIEYVSNPITGEMIALPEHEIDKKYPDACDRKFGYCPSTNKFKVLWRSVDRIGTRGKKVEIFTVGVDDKWRYLEEPLAWYDWYPFSNDVCFNGFLHWDNRDCKIQTFDLVKEKNGSQIPYPSGLVVSRWTEKSLLLLGNRICLSDCSSPSQISIWTMREYAVAESWTKDIVVLRDSFPYDVTFHKIRPFGLLKNGDILFLNSGPEYLFSYDPSKWKFKKVHIKNALGFLSTTYTPRFLSLKQIIFGERGNTNNQLLDHDLL